MVILTSRISWDSVFMEFFQASLLERARGTSWNSWNSSELLLLCARRAFLEFMEFMRFFRSVVVVRSMGLLGIHGILGILHGRISQWGEPWEFFPAKMRSRCRKMRSRCKKMRSWCSWARWYLKLVLLRQVGHVAEISVFGRVSSKIHEILTFLEILPGHGRSPIIADG